MQRLYSVAYDGKLIMNGNSRQRTGLCLFQVILNQLREAEENSGNLSQDSGNTTGYTSAKIVVTLQVITALQ
jgi:hypothetical protein